MEQGRVRNGPTNCCWCRSRTAVSLTPGTSCSLTPSKAPRPCKATHARPVGTSKELGTPSSSAQTTMSTGARSCDGAQLMLSLQNGTRSPPPPRKHRTGSTAGCVYISSPNYNLTLHVGLNGTKSGLPWDTSGVGEEVGGDSAEAQVLRPVVSTRLCVTVRLQLVCPTLTVTLHTCQLQEDQILLISQSRAATLCRSTTCCSPKLTSLL